MALPAPSPFVGIKGKQETVMSRRLLAASWTLCVALAACGLGMAQTVDQPSARWITAVSGKGAPSVSTSSDARSDRARVKEEVKHRPSSFVHAARVVTVDPMAEPDKLAAPKTSTARPAKAKSVDPIVKSTPVLRRVTQKKASGHVAADPFERRRSNTISHKHGAKSKLVEDALPVEKPKSAKPLVHRGGRPDMMATAARDETQTKSEDRENTTTAGTAVSMILKLAVVVVLAYLTVRGLKWLSERKPNSPRATRDMQVIDTVRLSNSNSVHLIAVKGKTMVIGCSSGQVNLLGEFEGEELPETTDPTDNRFAEYLAKYSGSSFEKTPAGRVAGMLRDCTAHLRSRKVGGAQHSQEVGNDS
jgi:flagellar biogenesis protein FliO